MEGEVRYLRKKGTSQIFAYSPSLMARGDMVVYDGPIPVPENFVVPEKELEMIDARQASLIGKLDPLKREAHRYVRKIGTKEVFVATPTLMARDDMVPYSGFIPVPDSFNIPIEEIELLKAQGKYKAQDGNHVENRLSSEQLASMNEEEQEISRLKKIADVILQLGPDEFTKDGLPDAMAIRKRIGFVVKKDERDIAWEMVKDEVKGIQKREDVAGTAEEEEMEDEDDYAGYFNQSS